MGSHVHTQAAGPGQAVALPRHPQPRPEAHAAVAAERLGVAGRQEQLRADRAGERAARPPVQAHVRAQPQIADARAVRGGIRLGADDGRRAGVRERHRQVEIRARTIPEHDRALDVLDQLLLHQRGDLLGLTVVDHQRLPRPGADQAHRRAQVALEVERLEREEAATGRRRLEPIDGEPRCLLGAGLGAEQRDAEQHRPKANRATQMRETKRRPPDHRRQSSAPLRGK